MEAGLHGTSQVKEVHENEPEEWKRKTHAYAHTYTLIKKYEEKTEREAVVKNLPADTGDNGHDWFLGHEDPLEKEVVIYSNILAWEIPWTEETGELWSMRSQESDTT